MKRLKALIRIKQAEFNISLRSLQVLEREISEIEFNINKLNTELISLEQHNSFDLFVLADNIRTKQSTLRENLNIKLNELAIAKENNTKLRQNIRAFEILLDKREQELRKELERIEQNDLDEMNSIE